MDDTNGHEAGQDDTALRRARVQHLLQEAQSLLLEAGARSASVYLERAMACIAVDVADDPTQIAVAAAIMPGESALRRAMGGALTIVGTLLARNDIVALDEFGRLLALFADVSAVEDPAMGSIIDGWSATIRHAAGEVERPMNA